MLDRHYVEVLNELLNHPTTALRPSRAGAAVSTFQRKIVYEGAGFLLSKEVHAPSVFTELCWFLQGGTNVRWLQERGCRIWNEWADVDGNLGPIYGAQLRGKSKGSIDQFAVLLEGLCRDPYGRRHILTTWNPAELKDMRLPPCHGLVVQFYVRDVREGGVRVGRSLEMAVYQRSADWFLGVPFNLASYATLLNLITYIVGKIDDDLADLEPGKIHYTFGDVHLYAQHTSAALTHSRQAGKLEEMLKREDLAAPSVQIRADLLGGFRTLEGALQRLDEVEPDVFVLENYHPMPKIPAKVNV